MSSSKLRVLALLLALLAPATARKRKHCLRDDRTCAPWSAAKQREIDVATKLEDADRRRRAKKGRLLPRYPAHAIMCDGRPCRPGEGNTKHVRNKKGIFEMWGQPYEHRESEIQSKMRHAPHEPDPATHYAGLVAVARRVAVGNMTILAAGDWDYRELVLNWVLHAHKLRYSNALVLSMDGELHADLTRRRIPSFDDSANLARWNGTVLQRHIQAVRMERWLAVSALVSAGLDVLATDASTVFLRDFVPALVGTPADVDVLAQRDDWPVEALNRMGSAVNAGFNYLRARRGPLVARFLADVVARGLIEFYLRWNNIADQYGWSLVLAESAVRPGTSVVANETTLATLKRWKCMQKGEPCLRVGFLPYDRFPRHGDWAALQRLVPERAPAVYHMTLTCVQEQAPCEKPGIRPFRGHRQRLDRYDDSDFTEMAATLKSVGAWLVDASPDYVAPAS